MPLSRLENFLKNAEGNILYVNPSDFDATDSIENRGNSQTRPFKTIQRALIEAARFSYQTGKNNDKIDRTTILVFPGLHYIDNRPGYTVTSSSGNAEFKVRKNAGWQPADLTQFTSETNFDVLDPNNELYKYNSTEGGAILPRGTSIIGLDLRKTKLRPLYVPDPLDDNQLYGGILRVTGTCYFTAFTIFDADISRTAYYDYDSNTKTPTFSHHKLAAFTYADGVNNVLINGTDSGLTDLDMFYFKVAKAYGDASGRPVPDYPTFDDFEPSVDEFRIVGDLAADPVGITSIKAGDGNTPNNIITVDTTKAHGLFKDTPVLIAGITTSVNSYNGSFLVEEVISDTEFTYLAPSVPITALPTPQEIQNSSVIIEPDTVGSASPYVFNCSLRSVYGLNGLDCDGDKATGFKSMVCAQFTGISIQKDDDAFILYNPDTAVFNDDLSVSDSDRPLHSNSRAIYKPTFETSHMRVRNNAVVQLVSIFAIAYARHFHAERGGDASITNSNSNFGQTALESSGFRPESFNRDDVGYITHVLPPREIPKAETTASWLTLDTQKTVGVGITDRLYLYGYNTEEIVPPAEIDSYKIGAKLKDKLFLSVINTLTGQAIQEIYETPILMQVPSGTGIESEKEYQVIRNSGVNAIISNVISLKTNHQFVNGEKIRVFSNTGETPNGIQNDKIYYAIAGGNLAANRIQLASTFNDALARRPLTGLSNGGGELTVRSRVSDKNPGDPGHPIQWDNVNNQWYILGHPSETFNQIFPALRTIGAGVIGDETGSTYVSRRVDNRSLLDRLYRVRYVLPKEHVDARAPKPGFVLQESKTVGIGSASFLTADLSNPTQLKNVKIIKNATFSGTTITIETELPHRLMEGDQVKIKNVESVNNPLNTYKVGYNGEFEVNQIISSKSFKVAGITTDPGLFLNEINERTTQQQIEDLPVVERSKAFDSLYVYRVQESKPHIPGTSGQDGVYNLTLVCGSIPLDKDLGFGVSTKSFSQDIRNLYPQQDRDNYESDPQPSITHADASVIGNVISNDRKLSLTREALGYFMQGQRVGYAVTGAVVTGTGNTTLTMFTDAEHHFNQIKSLNIINPGAGYNNGSGIATVIYAADLENVALTGKKASAKVQISAAGTVTSVEILDGGTGYGIGNTMTISAFPAGAPTTNAVVEVTGVFDNLYDGMHLSGFADPILNGTFKIVDIPSSKSISVEIPQERGLGPYYTVRDDRRLPTYHLANIGVGVTYIHVVNRDEGTVQILTDANHTLVAGNCFTIQGTGNTNWDDQIFIVDDVDQNNPLRSIHFNVGIHTVGFVTAYDTINTRLFGTGISANAKTLGLGENNLAGRASYFYSGISTTVAAPITTTDTQLTLTSTEGFSKGDYIIVGAEIMRFTNDNINNVLRGQFGTVNTSAPTGATIKKIDVLPMELRRPSILRASGHTFEYLGYGSGNYSTSLPQKQDRVLTDQETLAAQKKELDGGKVVYTGMNDSGDFYTGYKRLSSITGEEEVVGAPIFTYTGDDAEAEGTKRVSGVFDELLVRESITVEGGDNNNRTSQFYGPVNFTEKLSNSSDNGIETKNFFLRGNAPQGKLMTVGIQTPTGAARPGDLSFTGIPDNGGHVGHIYAEGDWRRFGVISREKNRNFYTVDKVAIGASDGTTFTWRDTLEVNGVTKLDHLFVAGIVTFASNQTFSGVTYDSIVVKQVANFYAYNNSGGFSDEGIKWENYGHYTIVDEGGTARLHNMEVVGTYVSFKSSAKVDFLGEITSGYTGINSIKGDITCSNISVREQDPLNGSGKFFAEDLAVQTGFATDFSVGSTGTGGVLTVGNRAGSTLHGHANIVSITGPGMPNDTGGGAVALPPQNGGETYQGVSRVAITSAYMNVGVITNFHAPAVSHLHEPRIATGIATAFEVTNSLTVNDTGSSATIATLNFTTGSGTDLTLSGDIQAQGSSSVARLREIEFDTQIVGPDGIFNNLKATTLNPKTNSTLTINCTNTTITDTLTITASGSSAQINDLTSQQIIMEPASSGIIKTPKLEVGNADGDQSADAKIRYLNPYTVANSGLTQLDINCGNTGKVTCYQVISTASGIAPFVVASTEKVNNLNADLLDDMNTSSTNQSSKSIVSRDSSGNFKGNQITANSFIGGEISGTNASFTNVTATTKFTGNLTGNVTGTASNATKAQDVDLGKGVLYNTGNTATTVSSNFYYQSNTLFAPLFQGNHKGNGSQLTNLNADNITTGSLPASLIDNLDASKITTGTLNAARIPTLNQNTTGTANKANDIRVDGGGLSGSNNYILMQNGTGSNHHTRARVDGSLKWNNSSNTLMAAGDIIAFSSDDRLKSNKKTIENALEKVRSLSGFTFNFNETAEEIGHPMAPRHAGVSAQEVQKVLPEAVKPAPADDKYLTVQYEKLVPLLIEAIKEQSEQIDSLKQEIEKLK